MGQFDECLTQSVLCIFRSAPRSAGSYYQLSAAVDSMHTANTPSNDVATLVVDCIPSTCETLQVSVRYFARHRSQSSAAAAASADQERILIITLPLYFPRRRPARSTSSSDCSAQGKPDHSASVFGYRYARRGKTAVVNVWRSVMLGGVPSASVAGN